MIATDISARPASKAETGFFNCLDQMLNIISTSALQNGLAKADMVIKPQALNLGAIGSLDPKAHAIRLGEATKAALPEIKRKLAAYQY